MAPGAEGEADELADAGAARTMAVAVRFERAAALATRTVTMAGGQITGGVLAREAIHVA